MQVMDDNRLAQPVELQAAVRNRYYFGKLLDVVHFDIEQDYFNYKRWLVNRLVLGYGVVCGLDVHLTKDNQAVAVSKGFAIDRWGREIIVSSQTTDFDLPSPQAAKAAESQCNHEDDDLWYHLVICYYECDSSPEPAPVDECGASTCVPSLVQERYKLEWRKGRAPEPPHEDCLSDLLNGDRVNRRAVAIHVTKCCPRPGSDPCLALANVRVPRGPEQGSVDVDITVRPIVYTNDLLYLLISAMGSARQPRPAK